MKHRRMFPGLLVSILFLAVTPAAHAAGDPTRGSTLYHTTYKCTDCHTGSPTPTGTLGSGATASGLLDAINTFPPMTQRYGFTLANNATDLADIAAYLAAATALAAAGPDLNQHGLTGSWYNPATNGQGIEVEVFPDLSSPGNGLTQVSWFTYDIAAGGAERQRWYTLSGPVVSGQPNALLTISQNTGGNFNALPTTAAVAVGTATLSFDTCTSGKLTYTFSDGSGRTGSIPLSRITQNMTCAMTTTRPTNADFAFSGNWYDAAKSGQGFTVEVNPNSSALFFAWYTYAPNGAGAGAAGQRWYTGQATYSPGARSIPIQLYETAGGTFDAPSPAPKTVAVGSGTLTFQSCSSAAVTFTFTGGSSSGASGTITLGRIGPVPTGCTQ
jgi:hypothetical protein